MAFTYNAAVKTARMAEVLAAIDADASAGTLEIGSAGFAATLAVLTLDTVSGIVSGDTLTFIHFSSTSSPLETASIL